MMQLLLLVLLLLLLCSLSLNYPRLPLFLACALEFFPAARTVNLLLCKRGSTDCSLGSLH